MSIPDNIPRSPALTCLDAGAQGNLRKASKSHSLSILTKLLGTIFFHEAPALATLRNALGDGYSPLSPDGSENYEPLFKFFSCVPLTTYDDYQPFVARSLDTKFPKLSDINNLLSLRSLSTLPGHLAAVLIISPNISILAVRDYTGIARTLRGTNSVVLPPLTSVIGDKFLMAMATSSEIFQFPLHQLEL